MKRHFNMFSIARGNMRHRKRQYLSLSLGIVLAIFFTATIILLAAEFMASMSDRSYRRYGRQDVILFACSEAVSQDMLQNGMLEQAEVVDIVAQVLPDHKTEQNGFALGRMNASAAELAGKVLKEGAMPRGEGEIALEWNALAKLKSQAQVGDTLELTLRIPDGQDSYLPDTVSKTYRLTGVLEDQYPFVDHGGEQGGLVTYPTGIVAESVEPGGQAVRNIYGVFAQTDRQTLEEFESYCQQNKVAYTYSNGSLLSGLEGEESSLVVFGLLGAVCAILVAACCLWIIDAFASNLEGRKHQIGLLRAVGATKRQIRKIFMRETLLLAGTTIPLALGLACGSVAIFIQLMGEGFSFHGNFLVLVLAALFGTLVVFLASLIPLRKAARIPPMQAIRNVELSRALKRRGVKPKKEYPFPRLWAERNLWLYRAKQVRISLVLAVSIVMFSVVSYIAIPILGEGTADYRSGSGDFQVVVSTRQVDWLFDLEYGRPGITQSDREEIETLPTVQKTSGEKMFMPKILLEEITPYVENGNTYACAAFWQYSNWTDGTIMDNRDEYALYQKTRQAYGYGQEFVPVGCYGIDPDVLQKLEPYVAEGQINEQKLSQGEEVLVVAPKEYGIRKMGEEGVRVDYSLSPQQTYEFTATNDTFHAGDPLKLSLLYTPDLWERTEPLPGSAVRQDATVRIGAILDPSLGEEDFSSQFEYFSPSEIGDIITTSQGIEAMGYSVPYGLLKISLSSSPDTQMEIYLQKQLEWVAARTPNCEVRSYIAVERENRQTTFGLIFTAYALVILFFAICTSMVNHVISARIQAGKRQIGTLRAVGASEREISRSFGLQMLAMLALGTAVGIAVELLLCAHLKDNGIFLHPEQMAKVPLPLWQPMVFTGLIAATCWFRVRRKLKQILSGSIVDNIREL